MDVDPGCEQRILPRGCRKNRGQMKDSSEALFFKDPFQLGGVAKVALNFFASVISRPLYSRVAVEGNDSET